MRFSLLLMETIGHIFRGWTQRDGNQTVYTNEEDTLTVKFPVLLSVQWKENFRISGNTTAESTEL